MLRCHLKGEFHRRLGGAEVSTEAEVELSKTDHFSALMNLSVVGF